jgi:alkylated DNA repair dioxygenase AlkB
MATRQYILSEAWIDEFELPAAVRDEVAFEELWSHQPAERGKIRMFGKWVTIPRKQKSYLRGYTFSGATNFAENSLPPELECLLKWVNQLGYGEFNQVFVNWYKNGSEYIGPHKDDERDLVAHSAIVSISFGAQRTFRVTNPAVRKWRKDFALKDGAVIVMGGKFQTLLKHGVPATKTSKERRINVTFRQFTHTNKRQRVH